MSSETAIGRNLQEEAILHLLEQEIIDANSTNSDELQQRLSSIPTVIETTDIPEAILSSGMIFVGNYPGYESIDGFPSLAPVIQGLMQFNLMVERAKGKGHFLAIGRDKVMDYIDPSLKELVLPAEKDAITHKYHLVHSQDGRRMAEHIAQGGFLWVAPGATTEQNGLVQDFNHDPFRIAMRNGAVGILAIETEGYGLLKRAIKLHVGYVVLPEINRPLSAIEREEVAHLFGRYVLARTAAFLPEAQRGEFPDPDGEIQKVLQELEALKEKDILFSGGFLSKSNN